MRPHGCAELIQAASTAGYTDPSPKRGADPIYAAPRADLGKLQTFVRAAVLEPHLERTPQVTLGEILQHAPVLVLDPFDREPGGRRDDQGVIREGHSLRGGEPRPKRLFRKKLPGVGYDSRPDFARRQFHRAEG